MFYLIEIEGSEWTTGRKRATERAATFYLATCRYADGPGMRVRSVRGTGDRAKAGRFAESTAADLVAQLNDRGPLGLGLYAKAVPAT